MDIVKIGKCISDARKRSKLTQEELAIKVGVSLQAVSKWENGHNLPDIDNLMSIAEITNTPYAVLLGVSEGTIDHNTFPIRERLFHEENMFTRMRTMALSENLQETYRALQYMRERHMGQFRKPAKYSAEQVLYINHPLLMACQAHAFGIHDDGLLAAILLHDVVEDTGIETTELPFSDEVKEIVSLVSFIKEEGKNKEQAKEEYYARIAKNGKACVVKVIDRCNNVSTIAGSFNRKKMVEYVMETERYILPLINILKNDYPEYSNLAFLVKYHIISVLETIKYLITE
ncbi:MAG: helix-turn-helix domain-containing protein [Lachnospiraceae bacterium]|nr:helix-turn-helix domain-containing protein [Lachnospiraceae bacterium]